MLRLFSLALVVAANNATSDCEQNGYSSQDCSTTTTPTPTTTAAAADDTTTSAASSDDTTTLAATSDDTTTLAPSDDGTTTLPVIVPTDLGTTLTVTDTVSKIMEMDVTFDPADTTGENLKKLQNLCALLKNCADRKDCKVAWENNLENCAVPGDKTTCKYLTYGDRASAAGVTCHGLRRRALQTSYGYKTTYDISAPVTANRDATTVESDLQAAKGRIENGAKEIEKENLKQAASHPEANKGTDGQPLLSATDVTDLEAALDRATVAVTARDAPTTAGDASYASALAGVSTVFAAVFV